MVMWEPPGEMCAVTFQRASSHGRVDPVMKADKASQTALVRATAETRPPVHRLAVMDGSTEACVYSSQQGAPVVLPSTKQAVGSRTTRCSCVYVSASLNERFQMKSCWLRFLHKSKRSKTDLRHPISFHLHLKNSLAYPIFQVQEPPAYHSSTQTPFAVQTHKVPICLWHTKHSHHRASPLAAHVGHETAPSVHFRCKKRACG